MNNFNILALDDGYGDIKGCSTDKIIRIPNAYADYRPMPDNDLRNNDSIDVDLYSNRLYDYISYKGNEGSFIVGESAIKQSMDINWYGGENKHEDIGFKILLKTSLGLMLEQNSSVVDLLVMGLPCESDIPERHKLLKDIALNHHQMEITLSNKSVLRKDIHVKNIIIKKQPFGSFCDLLLDDNGNIANKELANGFITVVDIGSRTLNIYTINRMEEMSDLTGTTNNGMYTSYMRVGKFIKDNLGFKIPTGKLPLIVKTKEFQNYNLTPIIDKSHKKLVYDIKTVLDTMFVDSYGYVTHTIFTGGGSEVLRPHIEEVFKNFKNIFFLDRYATARGLRKYGLLKSKTMFPTEHKVIIEKDGTVKVGGK